MALCQACQAGGRSHPPTATSTAPPAQASARGAAPIIARALASPLPAGEIPACFVQDEPSVPAAGERTDIYQPPPRAPGGATPAAKPTPDVTRILARASFALHALDGTTGEYIPAQIRETSVGDGGARQVTLFSLQYRRPPLRGGGLIVVLSGPPSPTVTPPHADLDDSLDAVRLASRLGATPTVADPLADPGAALQRLGCPVHMPVRVQIEGADVPADFISWPGAPLVLLLRAETSRGEATIETAGLDRATVTNLAVRLIELQRAPASVTALQRAFSNQPRPSPTPAPRTATPAARQSPTPTGTR